MSEPPDNNYTRRTIHFPEVPSKPSIVVQITTLKTNKRANEVADEIATYLSNAVPLLVLGKLTTSVKVTKGELWVDKWS